MPSILSRLRGSRRWMVELLVIVVLIGGIHIYRTKDMLGTDEQPAPPLVLPTLAGQPDGLGNTDNRPALVYFFAPWCHVCAASAHNIRNLRRSRDEEDFSIFMVVLDWQNVDEVNEYVARHELNVPVLLGTPKTARDWGVSVFPTYYIVDSQQRVTRRDYGYTTFIGLWLRSVFAG